MCKCFSPANENQFGVRMSFVAGFVALLLPYVPFLSASALCWQNQIHKITKQISHVCMFGDSQRCKTQFFSRQTKWGKPHNQISSGAHFSHYHWSCIVVSTLCTLSPPQNCNARQQSGTSKVLVHCLLGMCYVAGQKQCPRPQQGGRAWLAPRVHHGALFCSTKNWTNNCNIARI